MYKACKCLSPKNKDKDKGVPSSTSTPSKPVTPPTPVKKMNWQQKLLIAVGYLFTAIIALGCGISIAAAFITLSIMTAGAASYFIASLLFVAGTAVNWLIYKNSVPEVLVDMLGKENWFQGLFEVPGGCDLLTTTVEPQKAGDIALRSKAGYVRYRQAAIGEGGTPVDTLYFVNKITGECAPVKKLAPAIIQSFDVALQLDTAAGWAATAQPRVLTYKELQKISLITEHRLLSKKKKAAMVIGFILALAAGLMQGVLTYGSTLTLSTAFGFLAAISPAFPPLAAILATVTVVSLTAVLLKNIANWVKMHNVLEEGKRYFKNLFDFTSPRCELRKSSLVPQVGKLDELSIESSTAYIYVENKGLYFVDKANNSCTKLQLSASLCHLNFSLELLNKTILSFKDIECIHTLVVGHSIKSRARIVAERLLTALLTIAALPLAALGVYMTMNACAAGTKLFLSKAIPNASVAVIDIVSKVLGLGLAFLGRIPFTMRNAVRTIAHFLNTALQKSPTYQKLIVAQPQQSFLQRLWSGFSVGILYTFCLINAIGNGLIAMVGGGKSVGPAFGGVIGGAGTLNSLAAGVASGLLGSGSTVKATVALDDCFGSTFYRKRAHSSSGFAEKPPVKPSLQRTHSTHSAAFFTEPQTPDPAIFLNEPRGLQHGPLTTDALIGLPF
jgi:hypothetical protein